MVDRMVGLSDRHRFCGRRLREDLSAGRVQSVALRIICRQGRRDQCICTGRVLEPWMHSFQVTGEKKPLTAKFYGTTKGKDGRFTPRGRDGSGAGCPERCSIFM